MYAFSNVVTVYAKPRLPLMKSMRLYAPFELCAISFAAAAMAVSRIDTAMCNGRYNYAGIIALSISNRPI